MGKGWREDMQPRGIWAGVLKVVKLRTCGARSEWRGGEGEVGLGEEHQMEADGQC